MNNYYVPDFKSIFADKLSSFIAFKRASGLSYNTVAQVLLMFDKFVVSSNHNELCITKELIDAWAYNNKNNNSNTIRQKLIIIREFSKFCNNLGINSYYNFEIPKKSHEFSPHIFTREEIKTFFENADRYPIFNHTQMHLVVPMFFRLLYYCGLRESEAINLCVGDINQITKTIHIKESKNGKERFVPMSDYIANKLIEYMRILHPNNITTNVLLPNIYGTTLNRRSMYSIFRKLLWVSGISHGGRKKGPRIHDFRHSFAVHRLLQWEQEGKDINAMLPYLSSYLGHEGIYETEVYLHLTMEHFSIITEKMSQFNDIIPKAGVEIG